MNAGESRCCGGRPPHRPRPGADELGVEHGPCTYHAVRNIMTLAAGFLLLLGAHSSV